MTKQLRAILFGALCFLVQLSHAQVIDNFSDGDFANNPSWIGFTDSFTVSSGQLRSTIGNASSLNFYLATASTETFNSWEFFFRLNFNPSSQNFAEFWLSTDNLNIEQAQNGFFVRLGGNTGDGIGLFKKENGTVSEIIPQANTLVNGTSNNQGKIKVTRSSTGNWEIFEQITSANFISFGTGTDNSNFVSSGIGVWIKSTKSNRNKHYFDDIKIENTNTVDITPPTLSSATLVAPNQVELQFSEPIDETFASTNSLFSISPALSLVSSSRLPGDFSKVRLTFSSNLPPGINTITVTQAKDLVGNTQNVPQIKTVIVEAPATSRSLVINEIYADETPSNGLPLVEFIEIFNAASNPIQLGGDSLQVGNTKVLLPSYLLNSNAFLILCRADSVSKFSGFGPVLGISLPALTNTGSTISIKDNNGNILDQVTYALSWYNSTSKQNGGWSLEQINPLLKCSGKFNWSASNAGIGGTPGTQNSIFSGIADTQAPVLDSLIIVNANQIRLVFNEILNAELVPASNFSIPGLTIATVFSNQPNNRSILINLGTAIQSGVTYTLTYSGIKDCEGNSINTPLTKDFIIVSPSSIPPRGLVINEIYADETPSLGLPLVEFVELFNSTNQPIQLLGVKLSVGTSNVTLPAYVLNANAYITLCKTDSAAKFSSFGPALGIAIPVIANSGSTIRLTNANDSEIDAVTFTTTWYNSTSKQNGGWSLEQINPLLKCSGKFNWSASNAGIGGTPGTQNSIFTGITDTQAPVLDSLIIVNANQIRLVFNEILNAEVVPASSFSISGLTISSVLSNQPNNKSILVNLSTAIQSGVTYTLTYSGIKDCEGNNISTPLNKDFLYLLPGSLSPRALVINEIYADETPSLGLPLVEYIEIMNTTNQAIQLGGDSIFIGTRKLRLPSYVLNANAYLILCRSDSVGKFSNFGPTLGISIPGDAITNGGSNLIIKDINGNEIDAVTFSQSWYNSTSKQNGGWSLEQINPLLKCSGKFNWSASNAGIGGTPGIQNSIFSGITDTQAPVLDSLIIVNANQIRLVFNEILNAEVVPASSFLIPGLTISSVLSNQPNNKSILVNLSTAIQSGVTYTLTYSGIKDCEGNNISTPLNKDFLYLLPGSLSPRALVINEIYADETPSLGLPLVEYIEIMNTTNQAIQLGGDSIFIGTRKLRLPSYVLNANAYLILCRSDSVGKFSNFGPTLGISIPGDAITNGGTNLIIKDINGNEIDAVTFSQSWYNSTSKQNGGWSLEQINPLLKCSGKSNWSASNAGIGGTPGTQNSIFSGIADTQAPVLDSLIIVNGNQIRLVFNEVLNTEVVPASNFSIQGLAIGNVLSNQPNNRSILINLSTAIQSGVTYTLTYSGIKDCEGNNINTPLSKDFIFVPPITLWPRSLVINEIYADLSLVSGFPIPLPGLPKVEFIEILNTSNQAIQLAGNSIQINEKRFSLPSYILNGYSYLILCKPDSIGKFANFGPVIGLGFASLLDDGTVYKIISASGEVIDELEYERSWFRNSVKQNGGWSLEQINPLLKCSGKFNWSASNAGIGGTPGTQNSIFSNTPDLNAPVLQSLEIVSATQIRLIFNEGLNENDILLDSFKIQGLNISSIEINKPNLGEILINLSDSIKIGQNYTLNYSGIKDCEGNNDSTKRIKEFLFVPQAPIASRALVINEIFADETPSLGLPKVEYLEIYNTTSQPIQLKGAGILVGDNGYTFPDYVINGDSYAIICKPDSTIKFANFGPTIGLPISALTNGGTKISIRDFEDNEVDAVDYKLSWYRSTAKQNGGFSLEQINPKLKCSGRFNWSASDAGIGGTPGAKNSIFSPIPDNQPPKLDSIVVVKSNEIRLVFSEFINEESLPFSNFSIPGLNIIQVKTRNPNERSILITFVNDIVVGQYYNLTWTGVRDCEGNNNPQSFTQRFIRLPAKDLLPRNLVINEIYADETPSLGLPSVEYLEIYNTTDVPIQLKGATLDVNGTTVVFPEFVLDGKSYTVVCETDSAYRFKDFGQVLGLSLPTLSNDGAEVKIIDIAGNEIDVVKYAISWYGSTARQNGGFSLEQINPNLPCSGKSNWFASNAGIGGTPGAVNSINSDKQDTEAPSLVKVEVVGPNKLLLIFSEPLNALAPDSNSFKIPGLQIAFIGNRNPDQVSITLTFTTTFELGRKYNLTLSNIKDCSGNTMTERILSVGKGKKPGKFDLLITEVQADDTPENALPKAEYVELFNNTNQLLDLTGVRLVDEGGEGELPLSFLGPGEYLVLTSTSGLLKFDGVPNINVLGISPFITLNSEGDKLSLFNSDGLWLHQFHFNSSDYAEFSKWSQGWSLEMIDFTNPCDELNNWAISTSAVGGTPGMENSVKAVKPDLNTPVLIRATVPDSNMIKLKWNELLDSTTMANASISVSNGFQVVARFISSSDFTVLYIKADKNLIVNEPVTVTIGILNDCAGNATNSTNISTVRTGKADANSWILNEILFDPKTGGSDYVEIKNVSNQYLDLKEVILATDSEEEQVSLETIPIAPGGFALFTDSKALTLRDYPKGKSENFYEIGMPSFNSDSGTVRILGPGKQEWQKFFYSDKIHAKILDETKGVSLERISGLLPVNNSNSWQSASSDADYGTPGYENSQTANIVESNSAFFVDHKAFSPNGDGNKDFVTFNYNLDLAGLLGTLRIYSAEGLLVKNIAQTALLGKDGFWKWDGTTEQGRKARIGVYVAVLETVELGGDSKYYKIPVAIASEK